MMLILRYCVYSQLLSPDGCILGDSCSISNCSFTSVVSPPPLSPASAPAPASASGLLLGLRPLVGDTGRGILAADRYTVKSTSLSSSALCDRGLASLLA